MEPQRPKRVVILGGGFAGVSTARALVKRLRADGRLAAAGHGSPAASHVEVVLVNRENYFVFQPLLTEIIPGTIETTHVVVPLRRMLDDVDVEVGVVQRIEPQAKRVHLRRRLDGPLTLEYDALVLALGSVTDFRMVEGMAEHAVGVRTLGDAFYLRNRALGMLEEADLERDAGRRAQLLTFVVVGGGSTGVEVAAELHHLLETATRTFDENPNIRPRVVLVHSRRHVLPTFDDRGARYATRVLRRAGIDLRLGRRLSAVFADRVVLDDGSEIPTATVISTVGNAPHPVIADLDTPQERGWIRPEPTFAVPGLDAVWAVGDCASIIDPVTNEPMPATAQHAVREGPHLAANIIAHLDGRPQEPFHYENKGQLVALGWLEGVGHVLGVRVRGPLAWLLWRGYYLLQLPSWDRRIRVAFDWLLDLFLSADTTQIDVRRSATSPDSVPRDEAVAMPPDDR